MEAWDVDSGIDREELIKWCLEDRTRLTDDFFCLCPEWIGKPASLWLEKLLESCGIGVRDWKLEPDQLGLCQIEERLIFLNVKPKVHHKTDLLALRVSTMAHEMGHLRLHEHESEENQLMDCQGEKKLYVHRRTKQREREADLYGAYFLVPQSELAGHRVREKFRLYQEKGKSPSSNGLWHDIYVLARDFGVTPTLMCRRLLDEGWLQMAKTSKHGLLSLNLKADF